MRDVYVVGAASTTFGKFPTRGVRSLAEEAVRGALSDAGAEPDDVDFVYFANAAAGLITGQEMIRGQVALRRTGLLGRPIINVENACASGSTAFHLAWSAVAGGTAEVAMAVGAEKMTHPDKARTFAAFDGAVDLEDDEMRAGNGDAPLRSRFMDLYAGMARAYMHRTAATQADLAAVAAKSHANAARNPKAQYSEPVTVEEVLESRIVADPLTLLMCCPIADGAAALVLSSGEALARLSAHPTKVLASVVLSARDVDGPDDGVVMRASRRAYAAAGIQPGDVDVVELHDAAAPAELIVPEELGLVPPGGGVELLRSGDSAPGGRLPINVSGGLLCKGHPIGATGCSQIAEIADQLRGRCDGRQVDGCRIGLAENGGGWLGSGPAVATITILQGDVP